MKDLVLEVDDRRTACVAVADQSRLDTLLEECQLVEHVRFQIGELLNYIIGDGQRGRSSFNRYFRGKS